MAKMNKIYTEISVGELIDKITILEIKKKKISDANSLVEINKEYSALTDCLKKILSLMMV